MLGLNGDARALRLTPGTPHALGDGRVGQGANTAFENARPRRAARQLGPIAYWGVMMPILGFGLHS